MVSCKVPNCDHSDRKSKKCRFCSIPKNPETRKTWLKIIGIKEENCGIHARICTCHFIDNVRPKILTPKNFIPSKQKKVQEKSKTYIAKQKQIELSLKIDALNEPMIEIDDDNAPEIEIIENEIYEFEDRSDIDNATDEFESDKNIDTNDFNETENDEIEQNEETNKKVFGKAKFVCLRCKMDKKEHLFDCQEEFHQHLLEHKDNLVSNSCGICHRKFEKREELNDHKRVHTGEKPFKCPECWMRYGQISTLNLHIKRVHEDA